VADEGLGIAAVGFQHLEAAVPGHVRDFDQVRAALDGTRHEPARREWPEGCWIEAETGSAVFHDGGDVPGCETPIGDALGALIEDAPEDGALGDAGSVQPGSKGRHGAGYLAAGDRNASTESFLIHFRSAQRHQYALGRLLEVFEVEGHELRAPERTGKAEKELKIALGEPSSYGTTKPL
jgi:hypothetical protein